MTKNKYLTSQSGQASVEYVLICLAIIGALGILSVFTHGNLFQEMAAVLAKKLSIQTFIMRLPW